MVLSLLKSMHNTLTPLLSAVTERSMPGTTRSSAMLLSPPARSKSSWEELSPMSALLSLLSHSLKPDSTYGQTPKLLEPWTNVLPMMPMTGCVLLVFRLWDCLPSPWNWWGIGGTLLVLWRFSHSLTSTWLPSAALSGVTLLPLRTEPSSPVKIPCLIS